MILHVTAGSSWWLFAAALRARHRALAVDGVPANPVFDSCPGSRVRDSRVGRPFRSVPSRERRHEQSSTRSPFLSVERACRYRVGRYAFRRLRLFACAGGPRLLGPSPKEPNGPDVICAFFERQRL